MKIEAYKCDKCGEIRQADDIEGISPQEDLFDRLRSFPTVKPENTDFHFCMECYRRHVLTPVENQTNRAKDEEKYISYWKELNYVFRTSIILSVSKRKRGKK